MPAVVHTDKAVRRACHLRVAHPAGASDKSFLLRSAYPLFTDVAILLMQHRRLPFSTKYSLMILNDPSRREFPLIVEGAQ